MLLSKKVINDSELVLLVLNNNEEKTEDIKEIIKSIKNKNYIVVLNKIDLERLSSSLTSIVEKKLDDKVISGTINKNGYLKIKALKVGEDTTISQIIKLVEEASNSKAHISKLADKVSGIFVPVVMIISVLSFVFWILQGQSIEFSLNIAISVLVISCPCALGLATPVAIMVGTGIGAKNGILIKSAESLEMLHSIDTVVLDKTGTITEGKPEVVEIISLKNDEKEFLKYAASLEKQSEHPLSTAIVSKAIEENIELVDVENFEAVQGRGVKATIENKKFISILILPI